MSPTNLLLEIYGDDSDVEDVYPLESLGSDCGGAPCYPPSAAGEFIRQAINQAHSEKVRIVKVKVTGEFFLHWEERHPELVSVHEYLSLRLGENHQEGWSENERNDLEIQRFNAARRS
jgi:hypothetical protein